MERLFLKHEIVEKIKEDAELYGKVAKSLGIGAPSLRAVLKVNHIKLTQVSVLDLLIEHLGVVQYSDLLTHMYPPEKSAKRIKRKKSKQVA